MKSINMHTRCSLKTGTFFSEGEKEGVKPPFFQNSLFIGNIHLENLFCKLKIIVNLTKRIKVREDSLQTKSPHYKIKLSSMYKNLKQNVIF